MLSPVKEKVRPRRVGNRNTKGDRGKLKGIVCELGGALPSELAVTFMRRSNSMTSDEEFIK